MGLTSQMSCFEAHQGRILSLTSLWRNDQRCVCLGFWRDSPRADLGFYKPLENQPGNCSSWVLERLAKGRPWVLQAFGELIKELSVLGFGETHQGQTLGFVSLWRTNQGIVGLGFWRDSLIEDLGLNESVDSPRVGLGLCKPLENQLGNCPS